MIRAEYREPVLGFVDEDAGIDPAKPAVLIGDASLSYGELDRRAAALAHVMVGHGVGLDDPVAVMLPNGFEIMEAGIATAKAGAAFLPVNWHLGSDEVGWILSDSGTRLLISHIDLAETARKALEHAPDCTLVLVGDDSPQGYESLLADAPTGDPDVNAARNPLLPLLHVGDDRPPAWGRARQRGGRPDRRVYEKGAAHVGNDVI